MTNRLLVLWIINHAAPTYGDPDEQYATIGAIFVPDEVDQPALDRFREERENKVKALTQAVEQALVDLHAALTPEHRVRLAQIIHDRTRRRATARRRRVPPTRSADAFRRRVPPTRSNDERTHERSRRSSYSTRRIFDV